MVVTWRDHAKRRGLAAAWIALACLISCPDTSEAQDHSRIYSQAQIESDAKRLEGRVRQLLGLLQRSMSAQEKRALQGMTLTFPRPQKDDYLLDFYTYEDGGRRFVAMPILSLKAVEDLTLAYAYRYFYKGGAAERVDPTAAIDLYFAMIRRKDPADFPGGAYPPILQALGVPEDAYKEKRVGDLATSLRNEAWAFILAHEIGHILLGHTKGYHEISAKQAQAEEAQSDAFALKLLERSGTPAVGAFYFFTAQAYSLAHRGQFKTEEAWIAFMAERNSHPLTTARIRALARYHGGALAKTRPKEKAIWRDISKLQNAAADVLDDRQQQDCIAEIGEAGDIRHLKGRSGSLSLLLEAWRNCKR